MKTLDELSIRYQIKKSGMSLWIKSHRQEIDPDGSHIIKDGKNLLFDDFAVGMIDKIRGFVSGIDRYEVPEAKPAEIIMLQQKLEAALTENSKLKDEVIGLLRKSNEKDLLLAEEQKKTALLTAGGNQYIAEIEAKEKQIDELKEENARLRSRPVSVDRRAGSRWRWRR